MIIQEMLSLDFQEFKLHFSCGSASKSLEIVNNSPISSHPVSGPIHIQNVDVCLAILSISNMDKGDMDTY